jgi:IclR family KDG regulon transcriptional repressor
MARQSKSADDEVLEDKEESGNRMLSSVIRTLGILEQLAGHRKINLERLAVETALPKPTLYRFLLTLVELGYVYRDENDQYSLTLKMFSIGSKGLAHMDLPQVARPIAEDLGSVLHETVHMGILDDDMAMYILKIESRYTIRMYSRVGKRIPLYCTAIGKILLSEMEDSQRDLLISSMDFVPFTRNTLLNRERLLAELDQIRLQGFAEDNQEHEDGVRCIAVPIRDHNGMIVAGMSVSWPVFRFVEAEKERYVKTITARALSISLLLGYLKTEPV